MARQPDPKINDEVKNESLGKLLYSLRLSKKKTLRQVEEDTMSAVSNAYLSQIENSKVSRPSPAVLHALAEIYSYSYERLMELAGYLDPNRPDSVARAATFAIDELTGDEHKELLSYLAFMRSKRK